jgi:hypothetical protein
MAAISWIDLSLKRSTLPLLLFRSRSLKAESQMSAVAPSLITSARAKGRAMKKHSPINKKICSRCKRNFHKRGLTMIHDPLYFILAFFQTGSTGCSGLIHFSAGKLSFHFNAQVTKIY